MTIRINELIATLNSAQEAQDAVPAMRNELDRLRRALEASQSEAGRYKQASQDIGAVLEEVREVNTKLGNERDEAQFRALELEDKLATISKVMGSALGLVEPPKASEVKETPKAATSEVISQPVSEPDAASFHYHEDQQPESRSYYSHQHDPASALEVASSPSPTQGWSKEVPDGTPEISTPISFGHQMEAEAQSTPPAAPSQPSPNAPASPPPYLGVRWQDKPAAMSWSDFVDQGGERPYWM